MTNNKAQKITSIAIGALGLLFLSAAVYVWFTGGHRWHVLGIKISLKHWWKPWWIGTGLWLIRSLVAGEPFWIVSLVSGQARIGFEKAGVGLETPAKAWAALGMILGAAAGLLASIHYHYLVPGFGPGLITVVLSALISSGVHFAFFKITESVLTRLPGLTSDKKRASLRHGLYLLAWAALIEGPLRHWEARLTEPIYFQAAVATLTGLIVAWLLMARWRLGGWLGRIRPVSTVTAAALVLIFSAWSWFIERQKDNPGLSVRDRVILITIDTVRADHLSCYGYRRPTSPNLDAFAGRGARFTRAFCPMGVTDPSHASMFTGLYPRSHGVEYIYNEKIKGDVASVVEYFQDRGFATGAFTSRILFHPDRLGIRGFDHVSEPELTNTSAREGYRRALNWLSRNRDKNSFLWVHFFDPHNPYIPHKEPSKFYKKDLGVVTAYKWMDPGKFYTDEKIQYLIDLYDGEIAYMDMWIGRLLERIERLEPKSQRPPFIIILADHGEIMGEFHRRPEHFGFGHGGLLYNGVAHIPFMISWPGVIPEGLVVDEVIEVVDLAPTIADYVLGVNNFPAQGRSLRPLIEKSGTIDNLAFIQRRDYQEPPRPYLSKKQYAVVRWPYKMFYTISGEVDVYNLESDWGETRDISDLDPVLVNSLFGDLNEWFENTPDAEAERRTMTPSEIDRLRALGYIR